MMLLYIWSDSIEKYECGILIETFIPSKIKNALQTFDIFDGYKMILNDNEVEFHSPVMLEYMSNEIYKRFKYLERNNCLTQNGYDEVWSCDGHDEVEYNFGVKEYEVIK